MKNLIQAAVVTLFAASAAQAQQAVQWRVQEGGNGHWYQVATDLSGITWEGARDAALSMGGHLASLEHPAEAARCFTWFSREAAPMAWTDQGGALIFGPWIGGYQVPGASEPAGGWRWLSGFSFDPTVSPACCNDGCSGSNEDRLHLYYSTSTGETAWNDLPSVVICGSQIRGYVIEWSADCNNDGIVDKGQILQGQLPDINDNGIPDPCEQPTCRDADLLADRNVNGTDLGILLAQWGPNTQYTISDINGDGVVDGSDLGLLLSFWGPCPY